MQTNTIMKWLMLCGKAAIAICRLGIRIYQRYCSKHLFSATNKLSDFRFYKCNILTLKMFVGLLEVDYI